ncbi:MAG: putative LPS assembly protein LptD [Bacteroidota bacterium]
MFILLSLLLFVRPSAAAQRRDQSPQPGAPPATADTTARKAPPGEISTTILYSASDSINSNLITKIVKLYGEAKITYGDVQLEAEEIVIDYEKSTLTAQGKFDSAGRQVGFPVFISGQDKYETRMMVYNFKTRQAKIKEVTTKQGEGLLRGTSVFKNSRGELFSTTNAYTTCDLPDPHFRVISTKSKAIPGDKIVSGPFYLEFNHIPTPLAFLFGMFPSKVKATSGIIVPTYGEEGRRGFFLRGGGYFFDISEYLKLTIRGDVYSKGSSGLQMNLNYKKRYRYDGSFNFNFTNNRASDKIEEKNARKDFILTWSHSPQTKGNGRFSASVNAATSSFSNNNYLGINTSMQSSRLDQTTTKMSSNISYSQSFPRAGITLAANLRHNQDLVTKRVDIPAPDLSVNVNNLYPFRKIAKGVDFLENINVRLSSAATNQLTNARRVRKQDERGNFIYSDSIVPFTFDNLGAFFKDAKRGVRHSIPLSTSIKVLRYFTLSPSLSYDEIWYFNKLKWGLDAKGNPEVVDTVNGFNRVANYSVSGSLNTRIFGMAYFGKDKRVQALRHVIAQSMSFVYQPDYTDPAKGYFQKFNVRGTDQYFSAHQGYAYGESRRQGGKSVNFGVNNTIEMKVKGKSDTVARKISLFNTLSINTGYNFDAPQFKLSPFSLAANTNILNDKVNLAINGILDPYQYRLDSIKGRVVFQEKVDRYVWKDGKLSLGKLSSLNINFGTNLSPKGREKDNNTRDKIAQSNLQEPDKKFLMANPDAYVDFNIPWNLRLNYNFTYTKNGFEEAKVIQTVRMNGDVSLSEKWKIQYNTGYDLDRKEFTQTSISVARDLHCWTMALNWVPFGRMQFYSFSIGVKSSLLQDLKISRQRSFFDSVGGF